MRKVSLDFSEVREKFCTKLMEMLMKLTGYGPKVTQSVITAAFLFAFKDLIYEQSVKARKKVAVSS